MTNCRKLFYFLLTEYPNFYLKSENFIFLTSECLQGERRKAASHLILSDRSLSLQQSVYPSTNVLSNTSFKKGKGNDFSPLLSQNQKIFF